MSEKKDSDVFNIDINELFAGEPVEKKEPPKRKEEEDEKDILKLNVEKILGKQLGVPEEQEEEKKLESPKDDSEKKSKDKSSSLNAVLIAKAFNESGGLSSFDEEAFLKSIEDNGEAGALMELIKNEIDYNVDGYKNSLNPEQKEFFEMLGKGVPFEQYRDLKTAELTLDGIKDDDLDNDENLRKSILTEYLHVTTQMSDAAIAKTVKRITDLGEDIDESKSNLKELKEIAKQQIQQSAKDAENVRKRMERDREIQLESIKKAVYDTREIFPGTKINKVTQDKIIDAITKPVKEDAQGRSVNAIWAKRMENPVEFDKKIAYLLTIGFFDGDVSKLPVGKTKGQAFEELQKQLDKQRQLGNSVGVDTKYAPETGEQARELLESLRKTNFT